MKERELREIEERERGTERGRERGEREKRGDMTSWSPESHRGSGSDHGGPRTNRNF